MAATMEFRWSGSPGDPTEVRDVLHIAVEQLKEACHTLDDPETIEEKYPTTYSGIDHQFVIRGWSQTDWDALGSGDEVGPTIESPAFCINYCAMPGPHDHVNFEWNNVTLPADPETGSSDWVFQIWYTKDNTYVYGADGAGTTATGNQPDGYSWVLTVNE